MPDWTKVDVINLQLYQSLLDRALYDISLPVESLADNTLQEHNHVLIEVCFNATTDCIDRYSRAYIPIRRVGTQHADIEDGWNDYVGEKHTLVRHFSDWVQCGKPRQGVDFFLMKKSLPSVKLALRYCRQDEERMRADIHVCAGHLSNKDYNKFGNSVNKISNGKATKYANYVGGAIGEAEIAHSWCNHFRKLYNSVNDDGVAGKF